MEGLMVVLKTCIALVALKSILGFHWPWERIVKVKRSLEKDLWSIRNCIPSATYDRMQKSINEVC